MATVTVTGRMLRGQSVARVPAWLPPGLTPGPVRASAADLNELGDIAATFLVNVRIRPVTTGRARVGSTSRRWGLRDEPTAAYGINDRGGVVGVRDRRAVMWRHDGSVLELGGLGEFGLGSSALDINELSQVVGVA